MVGLWVVTAIAARREYLRSFRRSIEQQIVEPSTLRLNDPDPSSIETLVSELAHPGAAARALRDRSARRDGQAAPGHAAAAVARHRRRFARAR